MVVFCEYEFKMKCVNFLLIWQTGVGVELLAISCQGRHHLVHDIHDDFCVLWLKYQGRPETDSRLSASPDEDPTLAHGQDKSVAFGLTRSVHSNKGTYYDTRAECSASHISRSAEI